MNRSTEARHPELGSFTLQGLLNARAAHEGDRPAFFFLGDNLEVTHRLTYAELGRQADAIALRLAPLVKPGDRVLLAFDNGMDAVCLFWGCIAAGAIPVPAPPPQLQRTKARNSRILAIASDADVVLAITAHEHVSAARLESPKLRWRSKHELFSNRLSLPLVSERLNVAPGDVAYLQYTSGSTSAPRGVEITHGNLLAQCMALGAAERLDPDHTRALMWLPWFHDYGMVHGLIQPVYARATSFLMPTVSFTLNPLRWLEAIDRHEITHSGGPDFAYAACVQALARRKHWSARLSGWQLATNGAEPVRAATLDAFTNAFAPYGFRNTIFAPSYGLAEAVLGVTTRNSRKAPRYLFLNAKALEQKLVVATEEGTEDSRALVSCGAPLPGFDVRIVDPTTRIACPAHQLGEIWVAGPSVGRGYWRQPQASQAHFRASLSGHEDAGTTYLRTGDMGFLSQGELFIAGRYKDLIVVNGRNIYPQDLEQTAQDAHTVVRPAGVMAVSIEQESREQVVLLVECNRRPSPEVVRGLIDDIKRQIALEHGLNLHEIVPLRAGALPRTSSGKPQRGAARDMYIQGTLDPMRLEVQVLASCSQPENIDDDQLSETLTAIWAEVLGQEARDPDASFFDLGGDSLLATQLVSRIHSRMGVALSVRDLFEQPTLRGLARAARSAQVGPILLRDALAATGPTGPATHRGPGDRVELSFSQERMWFMHELAPDSSAYNVPLAIRLQGRLDLAALRDALSIVVERHEILRTRFIKSSEGVWGEVVPPPLSTIDEVWLVRDGRLVSEDALHRHLTQVTSVPFRLNQCPLFRAQVVHIAEHEAVLLIVMHHIISDQWSFAKLGRELAAHYSAIQAGTEASLPSLPVQYADFASWHRHWFEGERRASELAYWIHRLDGLDPLPLNNDFPRPLRQSFRGASLRLPLDPDHIAALRRLGAAHDASLSMVLIAALNVMLHRHTGKTDIGIGVPIANRHHLASENLIGTFVNTMVFRTDLDGNPDFRTVLSRVREVSLEAFAHQDMPFELLVRELGGGHGGSRQPLFNVMFNMVNAPAREIVFHGLEWSRVDFDREATQFDLSVLVDPQHDPGIVLEYATDLFERATIERMVGHLRAILLTAVQTPDQPILSLDLLDSRELALLEQWSQGPRLDCGLTNVGAWLTRGARRAPDRTALIVDGKIISHRSLEDRSSAMARILRRHGVGPGVHVGVCVPRSAELVVALMALLKAGAAYVPLDPAYPVDRLAYQAGDADIVLMLASQATSRLARQLFEGPIWVLDDKQDPFPASTPCDERAAPEPTRSDAAYLIYTSGSTGQPKGVVISHAALLNFLHSMTLEPGLAADDRLLAVTTVSFDIAALEILLPLGCGATIVMADEDQVMDGRELAALIDRHGVNVMQATPSRWHLLLEAGWPGRPGFKALVGGEALASVLAADLLTRCAHVWNMYGPTETTVWSTCWRVHPDAASDVSLGHPIANTTVRVLDSQSRPCPVGVMGEICIGGDGLALGYHRQPGLTRERFVEVAHPGGRSVERLYRTGDLGRWRADGSLEHCGRMDDQVKLRGFRIELGEIETRLANVPGVQRAVVAIKDLPGSGLTLVAYLVCAESPPTVDEVRQYLHAWLPEHMIPTHCVAIEKVPLLANGKTDRKTLPLPLVVGPAGRPVELPRNNAEQLLWEAWSDVLGTRQLGIHDQFFDVGGHSMLAVRLATRLERELGRPVPLGLIFSHTTIADCAARLTEQDQIPDLPVAALQPIGDGPPLFLLAGADMYRALARELAPDIPVYGLFSTTEIALLQLSADDPLPEVSVRSLAQEYLLLVRSVQPKGPYRLGGFSIGGVIAHELARLLREQGEAIDILVLLDCALPGQGIGHLVKSIKRRIRQVRTKGWRDLLRAYWDIQREHDRRVEPGQRRISAYARAIRKHQITPGEINTLFLQAGGDPSTEPAYGWKALIPGIRIERVPGRHMDILEPPSVSQLAVHFKRNWQVLSESNHLFRTDPISEPNFTRDAQT